MLNGRLAFRTTKRQEKAVAALARRTMIEESALMRYAIQLLLEAAPANTEQRDRLLVDVAENEHNLSRSSVRREKHAA